MTGTSSTVPLSVLIRYAGISSSSSSGVTFATLGYVHSVSAGNATTHAIGQVDDPGYVSGEHPEHACGIAAAAKPTHAMITIIPITRIYFGTRTMQ